MRLGCLIFVALYVVLCLVNAFCEKAAERRAQEAVERERAERQIREEAAQRSAAEAKAAKEDKLRMFSLQNAGELWRTYQALKYAVVEQDKRLEELKKSFALFGRAVEEDADYKAILAKRDGMVQAVETLHRKIEDAYLAWVKFQATPGRTEYAAVMKKALQDGLHEASVAESRFKELCKKKRQE